MRDLSPASVEVTDRTIGTKKTTLAIWAGSSVVLSRGSSDMRKRRVRMATLQLPFKALGIFEIGAPDRIRTCDLCLRRAALYPAELRVLPGETGKRTSR